MDIDILHQAEIAVRELHGPNRNRWLTWLETHEDQLRGVLEMSFQRKGLVGRKASRIVLALFGYWYGRHRLSRWHYLFSKVVARRSWPIPLRARILDVAATLAKRRGDYTQAEQWLNEGLELSGQLGDRRLITRMRSHLGRLYLLEEAKREWAEELFALNMADYVEADNEGFDKQTAGHMNYDMGLAAYERRDFELAKTHFEEARHCFETVHENQKAKQKDIRHVTKDLSCVFQDLGRVELQLGHIHVAEKYIIRSLLLEARVLRTTWPVSWRLWALAVIAAMQGDCVRAATLAAAAEAIMATYEVQMHPHFRREFDDIIASATSRLHSRVLDDVEKKGRQMTITDAVAFALRPPALTPKTSFLPNFDYLKVHGYAEILGLLGEGLNVHDIAGVLETSEKQVGERCTELLALFGLSSEMELVSTYKRYFRNNLRNIFG